MAHRWDFGKWQCQVGSFFSWVLLAGLWDLCYSCHPDSKYFHACLHTFLERDFPLIQAYQTPHDRRRGRVLLEGPTLEDICKRINDLDFCLEDEAVMCRGLYNLEDFFRLMRGFRATQNVLCGDEMIGLMDFLKHGSCLEHFRSSLPECEDEWLSWPTVWIKIFRLQVGPEVCPSLQRQKDCVLTSWYRSQCDDEAGEFYNRTFSTWLDSWCNTGSKCYPNLVLLIIALWTYTRLK